jgi:hypothetical protein
MDIRVPDWCLTLAANVNGGCASSSENFVADVIVRRCERPFLRERRKNGQLRAGRLSMGLGIVGGTRTPIGLIITMPAEDSCS